MQRVPRAKTRSAKLGPRLSPSSPIWKWAKSAMPTPATSGIAIHQASQLSEKSQRHAT